MHIKIDIKIFVFIAIFFIAKKISFYAILMIFGLIHEIGHLACGLLLGFKPEQITIVPYGLELNFKVNYKDYNKKIKKATMLSVKKIIIAIAGPITNVAIACLTMTQNNNEVFYILGYTNEQIIYGNLLIAIFNLIPIYPLDGGKIVHELLHIHVGLRKSYKTIQSITWISLSALTAISSVLILYYKNVAILIVIVYLWTLAIRMQKQIRFKEKIYKNIK